MYIVGQYLNEPEGYKIFCTAPSSVPEDHWYYTTASASSLIKPPNRWEIEGVIGTHRGEDYVAASIFSRPNAGRGQVDTLVIKGIRTPKMSETELKELEIRLTETLKSGFFSKFQEELKAHHPRGLPPLIINTTNLPTIIEMPSIKKLHHEVEAMRLPAYVPPSMWGSLRERTENLWSAAKKKMGLGPSESASEAGKRGGLESIALGAEIERTGATLCPIPGSAAEPASPAPEKAEPSLKSANPAPAPKPPAITPPSTAKHSGGLGRTGLRPPASQTSEGQAVAKGFSNKQKLLFGAGAVILAGGALLYDEFRRKNATQPKSDFLSSGQSR